MKKYLFALVGLLFAAAGCGGDGDDIEPNPPGPKTYTVTFNTNGGTAVATQTVEENQLVDEPTAPTKAGFIFAGWFKENSLINIWTFSSDKITRNTTLYAKWIAEDAVTCDVTFNSMGGSDVAAQIVEEGDTVAEPGAPTKEEHIFEGWYKEETLETEWNFTTDVVTEDITLYAKWSEKPMFTVTFNSNGGSDVAPQQVRQDNYATEPTAPTFHRFVFAGWYKDQALANVWNFETDVVTADITLYAKWTADLSAAYPGAVFIAPDGDDTNDGTIQRPFKTLRKAKSIIDDANNGKDTVYIRGGTYNVGLEEVTSEDGTWMDVFDFSSNPDVGLPTRNGTAANRICYWGFPGERPVFDLSAVKRPLPSKRVRVFYIGRDYYHFKNFEIIGTQVSQKKGSGTNQVGNTQSECFRIERGNYNIIETISIHHGMAIGFYIARGMGNLVLNCDAYENYDDFSGDPGNVDGFGGHPINEDTNRTNPENINIFRGCRAWYNGDDGFDLISALAPVTIDGCWSFLNGTRPNGSSSGGNGSGFKSGGWGMGSLSSGEGRVFAANQVPRHVIKNCLAWNNRQQGFYSNHHMGGIDWFNNTSYYNPSGFNMLNRVVVDPPTDGDGAGHVLMNNLSVKPVSSGRHLININLAACTLENNSFSTTPAMNPTDNDFISVDGTQLMRPRNPDGSLPYVDFMRPKPGSPLIGAGTAAAGTGNMNIGCF